MVKQSLTFLKSSCQWKEHTQCLLQILQEHLKKVLKVIPATVQALLEITFVFLALVIFIW